jgi:hypothetical protein
MDAKELRHGNWVHHNDNWSNQNEDEKAHNFQWDAESHWYWIGECCLNLEKDIEPIPLTEEWLEKLGFVSKYKSCHDRWSLNGFALDQAPDEDDLGASIPAKQEFSYDWRLEVKYVHQLQNLYFSIKQQELEIKETVNEKE